MKLTTIKTHTIIKCFKWLNEHGEPSHSCTPNPRCQARNLSHDLKPQKKQYTRNDGRKSSNVSRKHLCQHLKINKIKAFPNALSAEPVPYVSGLADFVPLGFLKDVACFLFTKLPCPLVVEKERKKNFANWDIQQPVEYRRTSG
ncbi:hypothetical protein CEXT_56871 [Caerostris extrusa]|uniref:Uncharacterized protein n=1 Tax=Caerostris extrusa TaxID=172846 RepID=A0AAV4PWY7_CAEEX|nr:hypothetical protein CEXT_56871 [Caerostris extrusa]